MHLQHLFELQWVKEKLGVETLKKFLAFQT